MPNESPLPYKGPLAVDITSLGDSLCDLNPGAMQRLRSEKEGIDGVFSELAQSIPKLGAAAGISPDVYAGLLASHDKVLKIRDARAVVAKIAEVLEESEAQHEHNRENEISLIVDAIKSTARRKDESILAPFEKTLKYNSQSAEKAVKTRRRNQAEAEGQSGEGQGPASPE